jgi:hypothetical protein
VISKLSTLNFDSYLRFAASSARRMAGRHQPCGSTDGAGNRLGYCPNAGKDTPQRADADPAPSVDQANWLAAALPGDKAHAPVVSLRWDR